MRPVPCPPPLCSPQPRITLFSCVGIGVDALLEGRARVEHHPPPRRDRHFLAGLRTTPKYLAFLPHHERAERRQPHRLATLETVGDFLQNEFDERGRFGTRQSYLLVDRLAQVSACDRFSRHRQPRLRRSKISL